MSEFRYHAAGNTETQERTSLASLFDQTGTLATPGVLGGLSVSQAPTANGTVLITAGACVLHPSMSAFSLLSNDTTKTLDILTANPNTNLPRNDIVVFDSVTKSLAAIIGTPNATPVDPTVPNTALRLCRIHQGANYSGIYSANMDDLRTYTSMRSGPLSSPVSVSPASGFTGAVNFWEKDGVVWCRGMITKSGSTVSGVDTPVFVTPAGMLPPGQWPIVGVIGDTAWAGRLLIDPNSGIANINNLFMVPGQVLNWTTSWPKP